MLSLGWHQFLCASRNLTDKCYLQCQAVGCKNPAEGPPRIFVDRECFAPFTTEFSWRKMPGGPPSFAASAEKILHFSHHFSHSAEVSGQILSCLKFWIWVIFRDAKAYFWCFSCPRTSKISLGLHFEKFQILSIFSIFHHFLIYLGTHFFLANIEDPDLSFCISQSFYVRNRVGILSSQTNCQILTHSAQIFEKNINILRPRQPQICRARSITLGQSH